MLLNASFKIITNILKNRLSGVVSPVVPHVQTAFIKGRYIMEGVVILHEALSKIHHEKHEALLFKVDFEKHIIKSSCSLTIKC